MQIRETLPQNERTQKHVLERLKQTWQALTAEEKKPWEAKALADKERYNREVAAEQLARTASHIATCSARAAIAASAGTSAPPPPAAATAEAGAESGHATLPVAKKAKLAGKA